MNKLSARERLLMGQPISGYDGPFGPGNQAGYNERADILVQAADGSNLNDIWSEIQQTLALWNQQRDTLLSRFTYTVSEPIEYVGVPKTVDFEEASEYGQPKGGTGFQYYNRGYDFKFYDLAMRFTWMFLAEASGDQIRNLANQALEADERLRFNKVMKTMFNPANLQGIADANIPTTVVKFYNGDGEVPPTWKTNTFTGSHTHYSTTQALASSATLTSAVLEAVENDMYSHGYTPQQSGTQLVLLVNRQEADVIRSWRVNNGTGKYDFIPAQGYGGGIYLPPNQGVVGQVSGSVPGEIGVYGPFHIVQEDYIPAGYLAFLASGGSFNIGNPVGIREHKNPAYRGLQIIPGQRSDYPLTDSFYRRGFGTGIRQRGAGFLVQVTNSATYTVPAIYA